MLSVMAEARKSLISLSTCRGKVHYRARGFACAGHDVYREDRRAEWLAKLTERGVRLRAEVLYRQLTALKGLRAEAKQAMLAESGKHGARKLIEDGRVKKLTKAQATRGLNGNYNHRLKSVFKSAAQSACASEPFKHQYDALLAKGTTAALARLTVTRKLAAITLALWKRGEPFDAERAVQRAA
jgi:transposase